MAKFVRSRTSTTRDAVIAPGGAVRPSRSRVSRFLAGAAVLALLLGSALLASTPSQAVAERSGGLPAAAGAPEPGEVVFLEDFQNVPAGQARAYQSGAGGRAAYVSAYPGYSGYTYTGSAGWVNGVRCNGVILSQASVTTPAWATTGNANAPQYSCGLDDGVQSWSFGRLLALAMGQQFGGSTGNFVYTSFSECNHTTTDGGTCPTVPAGETDGVLWQTSTPIPLPGPNRYMAFGVDTAALCGAASQNPRYQFAYRVPGAPTWASLGQPVEACSTAQSSSTEHHERTYPLTSATTNGTTWAAFEGQSRTVALNRLSPDEVVKLAGGWLEVKMYNATTATMGNDGAFDNVRALDVTPRLDKAFAPSVVSDGETSTLRLTVTNTDELNAKTDWNLTDRLPGGLRATGVNSTTCLAASGAAGSSAAVTAAAGAEEVVVRGSLAKAQASCTIDVQVKAWDDTLGTGVGVYTNGPDSFTPGTSTPACWDGIAHGLCGLEAPGEATLTVLPVVDLSITKEADVASYAAGEQVVYTVTVSNAASTAAKPVTTAQDVTITDPVPARVTGPTWTCASAGGATCGVAGGTGDVADTVTVPPGGSVVYVVTGRVAADDLDVEDITNVARATPPAELLLPPNPGSPAPAIPFQVVDPGCPPGQGCEASVTTPRAELTVLKSADPEPGRALGRGDVVTYTLTFDHSGTAPVTVDSTDDLRGVLDDARFGTLLDAGGLTVTGPRDDLLRITGTISADTQVVYTVVVKTVERGDNLLRNVVVAGPQPSGPDDPCVPGLCTEHPVRYLHVEKLSADGSVRLGGAEFVLRADDDGAPGAALTTPALTTVAGETGLFVTGGIEAGTYWLEETHAPDGYQLLANAVRFEIGAGGAVTLVEPPADVRSIAVSTTDGVSTISVTDRRAFVMPLVGGRGSAAIWISGGLLLTAAACLVVLRRSTILSPTTSSGRARTGRR